jgi:hypothetical protein
MICNPETQNPLFTGVNPFFQLLKDEKSLMVILVAKQVETLLGELEYLEPRLKALGVE